MTIKLDLTGHIALVTGASRGIGAAIAITLAEAGAAVAVNYRERADDAETVVGKIKGMGGRAIAVAADVSQAAAVAAMVEQVASALGPIDILVNNAGMAIVRGVDDLTEDDFDRTIAVNLKSAFLCTQAVLPAMRARRWGRIVNISSGAARGAGAIGVHYNASKAGMEGLTRGYAARLVKEGITVNAVAPSLIATDMMGGRTDLARNIPLRRMGQAEEVAQAVAMRVARVTVDLMRPVPVAPLTIESEVLREGRKIQLCAIRLLAGGVVVVGATVLKIKVQANELPPEAAIDPVELPGPDQSRIERVDFSSSPFVTGMSLRAARGHFGVPGPGAIWYRVDRPTVEGSPVSQAMRAMAAADFCNGTSAVLDFRPLTLLKPDLTLNFLRHPVDDWLL